MNIKTGWLTVTRKCNNFCEWCYTKNKLNCENMDFNDAVSCVDKLSELGALRVVLIGGEPTLYPNFFELVKYISSKGIKVSLATNGRKLSDISFASNLMESGINSVNISLKGTSEEEYIKFTKSYGLIEAISGYKNLLELGFRNVSLSYVIVDDNKKKFDEMIELIESYNLKNIVFQFVKPVLTLDNHTDTFDIEKMGKFVTYIYKQMKKTRSNYCLEISFPLCAVDKQILEKLIQENRITTCCHISKGSGVIFDTDFKILPCNHFAEFPYSEEKIGLKSSKEIYEFLYTDTCNNLRRTAGSYPSTKCVDCDKWEICGGGCFTRWFYQEPEKIIDKLKGGENNGTTKNTKFV